jgi:hypothetical protein
MLTKQLSLFEAKPVAITSNGLTGTGPAPPGKAWLRSFLTVEQCTPETPRPIQRMAQKKRQRQGPKLDGQPAAGVIPKQATIAGRRYPADAISVATTELIERAAPMLGGQQATAHSMPKSASGGRANEPKLAPPPLTLVHQTKKPPAEPEGLQESSPARG